MHPTQNLFGDALQRYLNDRYTTALRRQTVQSEQGWSAEVWGELADLGLLGTCLAERHGGLEASASDMMGLMTAFGRHLVVEPFVSTAVVGGSVFSRLDDAKWPNMLLGGSMRLALAAEEKAHGLLQVDVSTVADAVEGGYRITGGKIVVRDAPSATHFLVSAKLAESGNFALFLVPARGARLEMDCYRLIDAIPAADLRFDGAIVPDSSLLSAGQPALSLLSQALNHATAAVCAEALGVMRAMLDQTVAYTTQRKQFGVPLKNFQVLQHRMADMYVEIEQACSLTLRAYSCLHDDAAVSSAKIRVNQALRLVSHESVQMHGAIGTTDEIPLSSYFRRAAAIERQYGSTAEHYQRFEQGLLRGILAVAPERPPVSSARQSNAQRRPVSI